MSAESSIPSDFPSDSSLFRRVLWVWLSPGRPGRKRRPRQAGANNFPPGRTVSSQPRLPIASTPSLTPMNNLHTLQKISTMHARPTRGRRALSCRPVVSLLIFGQAKNASLRSAGTADDIRSSRVVPFCRPRAPRAYLVDARCFHPHSANMPTRQHLHLDSRHLML